MCLINLLVNLLPRCEDAVAAISRTSEKNDDSFPSVKLRRLHYFMSRSSAWEEAEFIPIAFFCSDG